MSVLNCWPKSNATLSTLPPESGPLTPELPLQSLGQTNGGGERREGFRIRFPNGRQARVQLLWPRARLRSQPFQHAQFCPLVTPVLLSCSLSVSALPCALCARSDCEWNNNNTQREERAWRNSSSSGAEIWPIKWVQTRLIGIVVYRPGFASDEQRATSDEWPQRKGRSELELGGTQKSSSRAA